MNEHIAHWCSTRIAEARNELQIIQTGGRYLVGGYDITSTMQNRANRDIAHCLELLLWYDELPKTAYGQKSVVVTQNG